ncbi:MAG: phosphoenolpyruvate mutase [Gammaproteobacteria bacterium]|nr:phosphoenolpyruvate mutase [Gammaproteobacteria bacterium]NIR83045.1 phosphoenolpyruvate mutase [Gammaproteobacteria bacterium]NIR90707.1 phosphoenolpyruvate mutase [Gammaproteobacteria bacterium]NIU04198.1 phosphoenolpyruvate mutase [Gammaproteobacteria bacterium]NIV51490.1 phosphoenolpyruvate mutase [Gammaproteobacteria bacterium]
MYDDTEHSSKARRLRRLLESSRLEFLMEAHNGLSARIVEEAGFKGIWASGLALSAQFGVRDSNEASWTQVVEMLEFMSDVTDVPILLDGDTGYGNFNNTRRLVRKLEQRGIAGVCIEDKIFPKTNSFIAGERQPLADIDEFCGKIKAGKDSQRDPDFCLIARIEALIAGWDVDEALRRAHAYREAGADAILIHSRLSRPDEVLAFAAGWGDRSPLLIVPTKYYSAPMEVFRKAGISVVIWANQMVRASVTAMTSVAREIHATETLVNIEDRIAPVDEIFRLQGAEELLAAEQRYFRLSNRHTRAVVLAATRGQELDKLTEDRPKVMLPVGGKPLLRRLVDEFKRQRIHEVTVVAGYKSNTIDVPGVSVLVNEEHEASGELASLACAEDYLAEDVVVLYGDLLIRSYILRDLLDSEAGITAVVDSAPPEERISGSPDFAYCSLPDDLSLFGQDVKLLRVTAHGNGEAAAPQGRWIGMLRARGAGCRWLREGLRELRQRPDFDALGMPDLLNHLVDVGHSIKVLYIHGHWLDVNNVNDIERAANFTQGPARYTLRNERRS